MIRRRAGRAALAASVIAVVAGASAIGAGPAAAAGTNCVPAGDQLTVAVVVDDGRSAPRVDCMSVPKGATGADLLRGREVRYDSSGLLCAIDGYPTSGCGDPAGGGAYSYWSYWWTDGNNWKYAATGPATRRLADRMVEGWHFITGVDGGAGNAPRLAPASITFGPAPPPEPAATNPPATQPTGSPSTGGAPTNGGPAGGPTNGTPRPNGPNAPRSPTALPDGASSVSTVDGDGTDGAPTSTTAPAVGTDAAAPTSSTDAGAAGVDDAEVAGESVSRAEPLALTRGDANDSSGTSGLLAGVLLGGALVGAVGSVRFRRRRSSR